MYFPKISIIVPSFNQGRYLEETLQSVINQQYPNLELFVVDGGSTDNSVEIIKKYEQYITWWVSEKDKGQSEAINKGFKKANGEIINWLCSDDLLTPGALYKVADYFFKSAEDTGLVHGGTTHFYGKRDLLNDWGYSNPSLERNLSGMAFSQPSAFVRKKYLDMVGGLVNENLHYGMDYDLYCRLACVCRFLPVKEIFSSYRNHKKSKSHVGQSSFISDWNRVFANLCKNAGWDDVINEIAATGLIEKDLLSFYYPFSFIINKDVLNTADKKKIVFYHYCYTLRSFYRTGLIGKAKKMSALICKNYPAEWWKTEDGILLITKRLQLSTALIQVLKKIKSIYDHFILSFRYQ